MRTVWVFGDQLNRRIGALAGARPGEDRVLVVESEGLLDNGRHVQRSHLVITAMRRFAAELVSAGFEVDLRRAPDLRTGLADHVAAHDPSEVVATEPNSRAARALCERHEVTTVRSNQFLCHHLDFAAWAAERSTVRMEDFYRFTRARLGYLMDGAEPVGSRWNYDHDNRQPPPADPASAFTDPPTSSLDDLDAEVLASLPETHGEAPVGIWATSRRAALARLRHFCDHELVRFGPYEDAMTTESWSLAHSVLSPYLNLGLLLPGEVCDRVEERFRAGAVPINSAEGFIRQVIGWREYVWGLYWLWPDHVESNVLDHQRDVPASYRGARTDMACVADVVGGLRERAWVHHIPRLMILSGFANLYGTHPRRLMDWMLAHYVDGADWVMVPNVMGMALWADGGKMATKPYVSGGAYVNRMSDYCGGCRYDPRRRTGEDACPFTTLYWDFLARHARRLEGNRRMARPLSSMRNLSDLPEVRARADDVVRGLTEGTV